MNKDRPYWFRAKRSGLGWGLPCSRPGWTFFVIWLIVLLAATVKLLPTQPFGFALALAGLTLIFVAVCYAKGEPLSRNELR
jgi:hypothetical protein